MTARRRSTRAQTAVVAVVTAGLMLTGCSGSSGADDSAAADEHLPQTAPGLIVKDPSDTLITKKSTDPGTDGIITVPSGDMRITAIETPETVPRDEVSEKNISGSADSDEDAPNSVRPADGESYLVIALSFSPWNPDDEEDPEHVDDDAEAQLALETADSSHDLTTLGAPGQIMQYRYLLSLPKKSEASLTLTQDGHTQSIALPTGEREKDPIAATYYRDKTDVQIDKALSFPEKSGALQCEYSGSVKPTFTLETQLSSATITPWTRQKSWADEGHAWLIFDGTSTTDTQGSGVQDLVTDETITLTLDDGTEMSFSDTIEGGQGKSHFEKVFSVPADISDVSVSATAEMTVKGTWACTVTNSNPLTASSDTVDFTIGA